MAPTPTVQRPDLSDQIVSAASELGDVLAAWLDQSGNTGAPLRGIGAGLPETTLESALDALGRSRNALERLEVELVREGIRRGLPAATALSAVNWVRTTEGASAAPPDAYQVSRTVRIAHAADLPPDALTERTLHTFYAGALSPAKTDQILRFVDDVQTVTDPEELAELVETMRAGSIDGPDPLAPEQPITPAVSPALPTWVTGTPPTTPPATTGPAGWGLTTRELGRAIGYSRRMLRPADLLAEEESAARRGRSLHTLPGPGGLTEYHLTLDAEGSAIIDAAVAALSRPVSGPGGEPDPRRPAHRRADALLAIVQRGLEAGTSLPTEPKAQVVVTIALNDLLAQTNGAGLTATGQVLSPSAVRRMACDAGIIPLVLSGASQPLDVGRGKRFFTDAQRLALWQRDRTCTFPGCTIPPEWCDAHHLTPWSLGGKTNLKDGAILCRRHHTYVHEHNLTATVTPTGVRWNLRT